MTNKGEVSDGYHTFNELYEHRNILFINVALLNPKLAFKTWLNDKKEAWEGWFILGINTAFGQVTYHIPAEYWHLVNVNEVEYNSDYDGHTSGDVADRLIKFAQRELINAD